MKTLFSSPLTPEELYWCGMIHADGSVDPAKLQIRMAQKERHVVEQFLVFLGQENKISHTDRVTNYGRNEMYSAGSVVKHRDAVAHLLALGVKSNPVAELYASRHFWRGLIDGDGTVKVDRRGYAWIGLCTGRPADAQAFSQWVAGLFGYRGPGIAVHTNGGLYVRLGAGKARALGVYLYKDGYSAVPRKRDVALSFEALATRTSVSLITFVENSCL
jgi:hypothetical protein